MSGWNRRRTSGEIINATLLEVFLTMVFVVFALAVFHKRRANAAEAEATKLRRKVVASGSLGATRDTLRDVRNTVQRQRRAIEAAQRTIDSLKFVSPYPPDCEPGAQPAELLTVTLAGPGSLRVSANRSRFGLVPGQSFTLTPDAFRSHFTAAQAHSIANGCRFLVRIEDTPEMPKSGYKAALAAVNSVFRPRGAFR